MDVQLISYLGAKSNFSAGPNGQEILSCTFFLNFLKCFVFFNSMLLIQK
jgi:hypothetical protein